MAAPRPTREEDLAGLFNNLDLHTRVQALEEQNHALEQRVRALEAENQASRTPERKSTIPESVDLDASDAGHEMVEETLDDALLEQLAAERQAREGPITWAEEPTEDPEEREVIDESSEQIDASPRRETAPSPPPISQTSSSPSGTRTAPYAPMPLLTSSPLHPGPHSSSPLPTPAPTSLASILNGPPSLTPPIASAVLWPSRVPHGLSIHLASSAARDASTLKECA